MAKHNDRIEQDEEQIEDMYIFTGYWRQDLQSCLGAVLALALMWAIGTLCMWLEIIH